jgi:hypothetical protein
MFFFGLIKKNLVKKEIVKVIVYSFLVIIEGILFTNNIVIKIEIDPS